MIEPGGAQRPLVHVVHHSPDGFQYGYGGSGPADLARSIPVDFFDLHGAPDRLPVSYQRFKWQFVATADRDESSFEISGVAIATWLRGEWARTAAIKSSPASWLVAPTTTVARDAPRPSRPRRRPARP